MAVDDLGAFCLRFGDNVRLARARRRLSQEALAQSAHINRTQISLLESGSRMPLLYTAVKLSAALKVDLSVLLEGISYTHQTSGNGGFSIDPPEWIAHGSD